MNIVMMTNTYKPIVGGLERSIETLSQELKARGHRVMIVVPRIDRAKERDEPGVFRVPAMTHLRRTDFPLQLPIPNELSSVLKSFAPQLIHSHHPFLIGDTALRASARFDIPLIFTVHTMYEQYTHYLPLDSALLKRFIIHLSTGYANLCDHVIAPGRSVAELLDRRGVSTPMTVVPTGVRVADFSRDEGGLFRERAGIPSHAFVVGTVGRLAAEKNIDFLLSAVAGFLERRADAHFLVVGSGPLVGMMESHFRRRQLKRKLHLAGSLRGRQLVAAYHAMDVFAFASLSETQGLVLAEAMAAGVPVVAIDAPGARDIVEDGINGRLLAFPDADEFAAALSWVRFLDQRSRIRISQSCRKTAVRFSSRSSTEKVLGVYAKARAEFGGRNRRDGYFSRARSVVRAEWLLVLNLARAAGKAVLNKTKL